MALIKTNNVEGGTTGVGITTGNSGGTSGNAFSAVTVPAGATAQYLTDATRAAGMGGMVAKFDSGTVGQSIVTWNGIASSAERFFRFYVRLPANFPNTCQVLAIYDSSDVLQSIIKFGGTGSSSRTFRISKKNAGSGTFTTVTSSALVNSVSWYRLEFRVLPSTTVGQIELRIYASAESGTITETLSASTLDTGSTIGRVDFGVLPDTPASGYVCWMDGFAYASTTWAGAETPPSAPSANSSLNVYVPPMTEMAGAKIWTGSIWRNCKVRHFDGQWFQELGADHIPPGEPPITAEPFLGSPQYFTSAIPGSVTLDSNNTNIISSLTSGTHGITGYDYGTPIYYIDPVVRPYCPTQTMVPTNTGIWGPNPFLAVNPIPMPGWMTSSPPGTDEMSIVVDIQNNKAYSFYELRWTGSSYTCTWGDVEDLTGSGSFVGGNTGAGIARYAGIVRVQDLLAGVINHALVFVTNVAKPTTYRLPATKTDGANLAGVAANMTIEEGTRIQLSPSYNVAASGLTYFEKIIATALQTYGMYCMDNGGTKVGIVVQGNDPFVARTDEETPSNPYITGGALNGSPLNITDQYQLLNAIPWNQCRALATWNGA